MQTQLALRIPYAGSADLIRILLHILLSLWRRLRNLIPTRTKAQDASQIHSYLQDGQIRLFELDLRSKSKIKGRLHVVKLESAPPFFALSYVCGKARFTHKISVGKRRLRVRPNLHAALERLQLHFVREGRSKVVLWIDAICIDQRNDKEKARQIQNMHSVFSGAEKVLAMLGRVPVDVSIYLQVLDWCETCTRISSGTDVHSFTALESLVGEDDDARRYLLSRLKTSALDLEKFSGISVANLFAMHLFFLRLLMLNESENEGFIFSEKLKKLVALPYVRENLISPEHSFWGGAYHLTELEWFQRVWTYQEIRLARSAEIFTDDWHADWKTVCFRTSRLLSAIVVNTIFLEIDAAFEGTALPSLLDRRSCFLKWRG